MALAGIWIGGPFSTLGQCLPDPLFDGYPHFLESAFEEVISGFDADQLLRIGEGVDERFEFTRGTELVARSADEKFGLRARAQEFEIVDAVFRQRRRAARAR